MARDRGRVAWCFAVTMDALSKISDGSPTLSKTKAMSMYLEMSTLLWMLGRCYFYLIFAYREISDGITRPLGTETMAVYLEPQLFTEIYAPESRNYCCIARSHAVPFPQARNPKTVTSYSEDPRSFIFYYTMFRRVPIPHDDPIHTMLYIHADLMKMQPAMLLQFQQVHTIWLFLPSSQEALTKEPPTQFDPAKMLGHARTPTMAVKVPEIALRNHEIHHKSLESFEKDGNYQLVGRISYARLGEKILGSWGDFGAFGSIFTWPTAALPKLHIRRQISEHTFSWTDLSHKGHFLELHVLTVAYLFSFPSYIHALAPGASASALNTTYSPFTLNGTPNVLLKIVKRGEDDSFKPGGRTTFVLRLYEAFGGQCRAQWRIAHGIAMEAVYETNLLEDVSATAKRWPRRREKRESRALTLGPTQAL
ncbi:hypothetical protein C8J57DRAFT_1262999 [Mycena rebaudengoi]|nr:hypothetical protein C8J57DRAFT_1262999 [Mycena rebaudengoi]